MWERTKRLINSYLDDLIERTGRPDKGVRDITRGEVARLNELEVQARAAVKMLEKELAEVELKIIGASEREQIARQRGDAAGSSSAISQLSTLSAHRDLLKKQIEEANASAARARSLREERRRSGEELANETHLTSMRETLASIQTPFDATDPAATIDEMRARINYSTASTIESRVAEADRELEAERTRSRVDDALARYKEIVSGGEGLNPEPVIRTQTPTVDQSAAPPANQVVDESEPEQGKTLGRSEGPHRPID